MTDPNSSSTPPPDPPPKDMVEEAIDAVLLGQANAAQRRLIARDKSHARRLEDRRRQLSEPSPPLQVKGAAAPLEAPELADKTQAEPEASPKPGHNPTEIDDLSMPSSSGQPRRAPRTLPTWPMVIGLIIVLATAGFALMLTGRDDSDKPKSTTTQPVEGPEVRLAKLNSELKGSELRLGNFPNQEALLTELRKTETPQFVTAPGPTTKTAADAARRCDLTIQSSSALIQPSTGFRFADVGSDLVLVLSNPVSASPESVEHTQLTLFEPLSCVPLAGVQR